MGNGEDITSLVITQCVHIKDNGERCKAHSVKNSDRCFWHPVSKKRTDQRRKAQKKGAVVMHARKSKHRAELDEARAKLSVEGFDDLASLCALRILDPKCSTEHKNWARLLFDCLEKVDGQQVIYHVVEIDPLSPEGFVPPLPELPGYTNGD